MTSIRHHSSDDMVGLGELKDVVAPVAAVLRPDGSLDIYGQIEVIDQRPEPAFDRWTVIGIGNVEAGEMYVSGVVPGHQQVADVPATEHVLGFDLQRVAIHVRAGNVAAAERQARLIWQDATVAVELRRSEWNDLLDLIDANNDNGERTDVRLQIEEMLS